VFATPANCGNPKQNLRHWVREEVQDAESGVEVILLQIGNADIQPAGISLVCI